MVDLVAELTNEITTLIVKFNKEFDKLRFKIYRKLTVNSEKLLLFLREGIAALIRDYDISLEPSEISVTDEVQVEEADMITCPRCNFKVKKSKFCNKCGAPLGEIHIRSMENRITKISALIKDYEIFLNLAKKVFTEAELKISDKIELILKQILEKQTKQYNHQIDVMAAKRAPRPVPKPVVPEIPITPTPSVKIVDERPIITPTEPVVVETEPVIVETEPTIIESRPIIMEGEPSVSETIPEIGVKIERKQTVYSRFERNLVNYWFFYLSIFLLTIGVIVTVVFVVRGTTSITEQLIIIYSIGAVILLIGETIALLSKRRERKKQREKESKEEIEDIKEVLKGDEGRFPLPAFGSVIIFIGLLVIYTAGIVGFGSTISRGVFVYISFGVAFLAIFLGIINDSEMITLTGFIPPIAIVIVDLTWEGTPALNEAGVLIAFTIPIIVATITAIFFKKWWGTVVMVTVLPVLVCIPEFSTKMGLEFIPLLLIPVMILLVTRYDKNNIPFTHKKILVFLSQIIPIVGLFVISSPAINFSATEPLWAKIKPVGIIIASLVILGTSFFYQFIQEKYLEIKSKVCIFYHFGQGLVGVLSIVMVVLNRDSINGFIYSIIYFSIFFIIGVLGILKVFKEHLTLAGTIVSFALAEIQAIFMFSLLNIAPEMKLGAQFASAIVFTLLAILTVVFAKFLNVSEHLFSSWIIISAINNMVFIFLQKANYWFIFSSLALFLILPLLSMKPNKGVPNYIGQIAAGILSVTMILANLGNPNNYLFSIIYFVSFFILGIIRTIFRKNYTLVGTIITFSIAEVHAILILTLFNLSNTLKLIVYFIVGVSFILLAISSIILSKKLEVTRPLFTPWIVFSVINVVLLTFMQKVNTWFIIGAILVFLVLPILNFKPNIGIPYYMGLTSIGVLTLVLAGLNHASPINYIFLIICFSVFFIIGILGLIKKLQKHYTFAGTIISFAFAEALVIISMIILNTTTTGQLLIYILMAVSFLVLTFLAIVLFKVIKVSKYLYYGWLGASVVNSLLLILMNRVNNWIAFAIILLFFIVTSLEMEPNIGIGNIVGKCSVGALSIIMITTNLSDPNNYIYNIVFYGLFFIMGTIGLLKVLKKYFTITGSLITLGFAEVLVILSMVLQNTSTVGQLSIYFIMAISFLILSVLSITLVKFFEVSEYLYIGFIGASLVNSLLLLLMNKVNNWFAFAIVLLFFAVTAIELKPNVGRNQIIGKVAVGILSVIMVTTNLSDPNNFIYNAVFFGLFFIIGTIGLIKAIQKHLSLPAIIISFGFAEVLAILIMILFNTTTIGPLLIYFITAISFLILSFIAITLTKFFQIPEYLYYGFIGASVVNTLLLLFMNKIDNWYAFAVILLFFAVTAIERKPNVGIGHIVGKSAVGILSIIMVTTSLSDPNNYIYNVVLFGLFFIIGTIGLLNVLKKHFNKYATILSLGIAEVLAILLMVLFNTTTVGQIIIYFIIAISFLILSFIAITLTKFFQIPEYLYYGFIGASVVNSLLLFFMNKVNNWYAFAFVLLFFAVTAIERKPNVGIGHIVGKSAVGILSIIMVTMSLSDPNNFIYNVVYFGMFFIIGTLGLVKVLKKHFNKYGTIIALGFAEVLAILIMVLFNTATIGQLLIYFIAAISFLILSFFAIALTKAFEIPKYLYFGFIGASVVNTLLLFFMNKVNNWYAFAVVLLFFAITAIERKPNVGIGHIVGKCTVGALSIIMVTTSLSDPNNFIYNAVYFGMFFLVGVIGLLNVLQKHFNQKTTFISLGLAEVQAILLMVLMTLTSSTQISIYFIIAISFNFIALISVAFPKVFLRSDVLLIGWVIISSVNATILGLTSAINPWFTFTMVIFLLALVALINLPLFGQKIENWRLNALASAIIVLVVISIFIFTDRLSFFKYALLVIFLIYAAISIPVFINWKKEEVVAIE